MSHESDDYEKILPPALDERSGEMKESRFDSRSASPFIEKSLSEHTRRAYRLAIAEFFRHAGMKHLAAITPADVISWRDDLVRRKKKAATVAFKLSVLRSFFEYLRAGASSPSTRLRPGWSPPRRFLKRKRAAPSHRARP